MKRHPYALWRRQDGYSVRFTTLARALADLLQQESVPAFEQQLKRYGERFVERETLAWTKSLPELLLELRPVMKKALALHPDERFPSASSLLDALVQLRPARQ